MEATEIAQETTLRDPKIGGLSRAWSSFCVFLTCLFLLCAATEALSWIVRSLKPRTPPPPTGIAKYQNAPWWKDYWKEFDLASKMQYRPYVIWRRAPFHGRYINVDSKGLRRTMNPQCTPGAPQIWMFGDSALWGAGARDENTIPSLLSEEYARTHGPVCVTNFGEAGWVSTQGVIQLELALKDAPAPPDLVIFYFGYVEAFVHYQSDMAETHLNFDIIRSLMEDNERIRTGFQYLRATNTFLLIDTITGKFESLKEAEGGAKVNLPQLNQRAHAAADDYSRNIQLAEALSKSYGFQFADFWDPAICLGHKPLTAREERIQLSMDKSLPGLANVVEQTHSLMLSSRDPHIFDLSNLLDGMQGDFYLNQGHLTEEGNRLVALRILDELGESGALSKLSRGNR
jgi:hypothetical protein